MAGTRRSHRFTIPRIHSAHKNLQRLSTIQQPLCHVLGGRGFERAQVEDAFVRDEAVTAVKSLIENSEACCFRGKGCMARRDEREYPSWVFD